MERGRETVDDRLPPVLPLVLVDATASMSGGAVYLRNLIAHLQQHGAPFRPPLLRTSDFVITVADAGLTQIT